MARKAVEYVAISNLSGSDWEVLARGADKAEVERVAYIEIDRQYPDRTDLYNDTLRANLKVVALSTARNIAGRCVLGECEHWHENS